MGGARWRSTSRPLGYNRVRLASVRASTDCWRRLCPARCSKIGEGAPPPPTENAPSAHPSSLQLRLPLPSLKKKRKRKSAPYSTYPSTPLPHLPLALAAGLTSPHQNVRWQNRKAAVCSRHLKVHLRTFPAKSFSPPLSLPRQREWAAETQGSARTWAPITSSFFFFPPQRVWLHFCYFFSFFFFTFSKFPFFHFPPPPPIIKKKNLTRHDISPQLF